MKYILAGNSKQCLDYCLTENLIPGKDVKYIHSKETLLGVVNPEIIRIGTWYERSDLPEIEEVIGTRRGKSERNYFNN